MKAIIGASQISDSKSPSSVQIDLVVSARISELSLAAGALVCVPICEETISLAKQEIARAAQIGDLLEIRLDYLNDFTLAEISELVGCAHELDKPLILTFRPKEQGGHRALEPERRLQFWKEANEVFKREFFDIELDLLRNSESIPELDWNRVICSHHDFDGVPSNLSQIYEAMVQTPARFVKIAVSAHDAIDCLPIFELLGRAESEGRLLIAIAMGQAGLMTRVLGPARGSYLTYGSSDDSRSTAPGQLSAVKLRDLYRISRLTRDSRVMGLVGSPVAHSISPDVHNAAFEATGVNAVYLPLEVRDLAGFMKRMAHPRSRELDWNLAGLSITAPHKSTVLEFLDWIHPAAREIGAVNTVVIDGESLRGYNTDAIAVLNPVIEMMGSLSDARCAVIGAGGAAKAALWSLKNEGAKTTVFARDNQKGRTLASAFDAHFQTLAGSSFNDFDLVINATPLGTHGTFATETVATSHQLQGARLAYDLVYNPSETLFMREARAAGCETIGGLSMLVLQGVEQFKLWTGLEAPVDVMRGAAEKALKSS
ncbi:MAG TPA: shikimate dehydrogenase [Pyrinomonadaceae bacterium]|nr:shikimate dehydrogenase [Pyrinomonadaceae bacterium]